MELLNANDIVDLLNRVKASKRNGRGEYSYPQLAKRLGYRSPRTIAMVIKRQRAPSTALIQTLCEFLKLEVRERDFVFALAEKSRLEMKGRVSETVEARIAAHKRAAEAGAEVCSVAGVKIEIEASVAEPIKQRIRALISELEAFRTNPSATSDTESATHPHED